MGRRPNSSGSWDSEPEEFFPEMNADDTQEFGSPAREEAKTNSEIADRFIKVTGNVVAAAIVGTLAVVIVTFCVLVVIFCVKAVIP